MNGARPYAYSPRPANGGTAHEADAAAQKRASPSPGTPLAGPRGGQTISESELMRRRRLLDSHLISQDQPAR